MKAFITGVTGQTGSYLAEHLINLGYDVYGLVRRSSEPNYSRIKSIIDHSRFHVVPGDLTDSPSIFSSLLSIQPDEVYNLAAQSHVWESFKQPQYTLDTIVTGTLNILEGCRQLTKRPKIYLSSSSEMYGSNASIVYDNGDRMEINFKDSPEFLKLIKEDVTYKELWTCVQDELTQFKPNSPYAVAKLAAHNMGRVYRDSYEMFVSQAVLHNHESPRRGSQFVTQKIIKYVANYKKRLESKRGLIHWCDTCAGTDMSQNNNLFLGNTSAYRDWGYAKEYAEAQHLILQHDQPEDFVIGTGEAHSVKEFLDYVFDIAEINPKYHVVYTEDLFRPNEVPFLQADPDKARRVLKWEAKTKFKQLVEIMYEAEKSKTS